MLVTVRIRRGSNLPDFGISRATDQLSEDSHIRSIGAKPLWRLLAVISDRKVFLPATLANPNPFFQLSGTNFCRARCQAKPCKNIRGFGALPGRWQPGNIVAARIQINGSRIEQCVRNFGGNTATYCLPSITYVVGTPMVPELSCSLLHRTLFYATDDFGGRRPGATAAEVHARFTETLSRARPKELAHDYLEREAGSDAALVSSLVVSEWEKSRTTDHEPIGKLAPSPSNDLDARQQAAAERWAARQQNTPTPGQATDRNQTHTQSHSPAYEKNHTPELRRHGPEDDLEL
jgi:hypothetical protein